MLQLSFENFTKKTRKQRFLKQMDAVLPWNVLRSKLEP